MNKRRFAIGDVQGCFETFLELLKKISFSESTDHLYFVGDLVNRGPQSLEVLSWVHDHRESCSMVIGNHELLLLAAFDGIQHPRLGDTIDQVLESSRATELCNWLTQQPFVLDLGDALVVHAGLNPLWNLETALNEGAKLSRQMSQKSSREPLLRSFFAKDSGLNPLHYFTILRAVDRNTFALQHGFSGELVRVPEEAIPWFNALDSQQLKSRRMIFGHWAALGLFHHPNFVSLDSACVWGKSLTAYDLDRNRFLSVNNREIQITV